ncbi:MAG: uroporphyrinogen decarboxylase family protein [Eubacteriales bacterium]|nr:uroporphyrinogen decarboxylase family protein [Eubacteriales bacterium]
MTKREKYLSALRNEATGELIWAPNFDYWYNVNRAEDTLPAKYSGMSGPDIVRAVGGSLWYRCSCCSAVCDSSVKTVSFRTEKGDYVTEISTPSGTVRSVERNTEGIHRSRAVTEHYIKNTDDIKVMKYIAEATSYIPTPDTVEAALKTAGDDGIVLTQTACVPFLRFAKSDAGYANAFYIWTDHRGEVDGLIEVYEKKALEIYAIAAQSKLDLVESGDNMDGLTMSPAIFEEYALPFYAKVKELLRPYSKPFEVHWCGRTENLIKYLPDSGVDILEAAVSRPMANITLSEILDILDGKVVLQGGIPSVLMCEEGCSYNEFIRYMYDVIMPLAGRRGFILGMSDNVPPNADFRRVEAVSEIIAGRYRN